MHKCFLNQNKLTLTEDKTKITVACLLHYTIQKCMKTQGLKDAHVICFNSNTQMKGKHTLNYSRILPSNYFGKQE